MANVHGKMACGGGECPEEYRKGRRRMLEMRRLTAGGWPGRGGGEKRKGAWSPKRPGGEKRSCAAGDEPTPLPPEAASSSSSSAARAVEAVASMPRAVPEAAFSPPAFGSVALAGRSRKMEDEVSVRPAFFRPTGGAPLHFFAVFDGHGGAHVSALCKERMHVLLAEELRRESAANEERRWRAAVGRCFGRMDDLAVASCSCDCERSGVDSDLVGSTAVVALLARRRLLVANCGDSRAVLSRGGLALPLSTDHKPDRPDELARIEAAGGRVIYLNGARVNGILAMSRALGDKYLKPMVISEPKVVIVERTPEDECLIIASDGLWDVVSNDLACGLARHCLEEDSPTKNAEDITSGVAENTASAQGEEYASEARCSLAAALLARLALGRRSADNISVIVVDLRGG